MTAPLIEYALLDADGYLVGYGSTARLEWVDMPGYCAVRRPAHVGISGKGRWRFTSMGWAFERAPKQAKAK